MIKQTKTLPVSDVKEMVNTLRKANKKPVDGYYYVTTLIKEGPGFRFWESKLVKVVGEAVVSR